MVQPHNNRFVWLAIGVVVGALSFGLLPSTPLHATATHGQEGFAICTGPVDNAIEGVYILDYLTGDLKGYVLNPNGKFAIEYEYNILRDFEASKSPKFVITTGLVNVRRGAGRQRVATACVYVADASSGVVAAYGVPYDPSAFNSATAASTGPTKVIKSSFVGLDIAKFRTIQIRQK